VSGTVHVAGIIPLANLETDYDVEVPACMLPLNAGFTAIQKSVFECAMAGCDTIWIVANADLAPIVRKTVGEWVYDPVYYNRTMTRFYKEVRKEIPIYYVPIDVRDRDRRDSYGWSILHGVNSAWWVGNRISKWLVPEKYFISFPLAAYDIYSLRDHRKKIANKNFNFFTTYHNKTVKDNLPLSFTMTGEDFIQCRRNVNKLTTREYLPPSEGEKFPSQKLPLEQRWSARSFDFATVFDKVDVTDGEHLELEWFHDLSGWKNYKAFLGSDNIITKPYKDLTGPHRHAKICLIKDEE
tara:strand:+ start:357 stop:1244 length:888 start_codon:yes stop_codon:yes gene_type:complete